MVQIWLSLKNIPAEGQKFFFFDSKLWTDLWIKFKMSYTMGEPPISAAFILIPYHKGYHIKGNLNGTVLVPCDRCAEPAKIVLNSTFEEYEEIKPLPQMLTSYDKNYGQNRQRKIVQTPMAQPNQNETSDQRLLYWHGPVLKLDVSSLLWEEFILAMPVKPLCTLKCLGLCPTCGYNLTSGPCKCAKQTADLRLSSLHNLIDKR
ncbi:DUF177 domain-containing protein [Desulfovibrionales bacterium]